MFFVHKKNEKKYSRVVKKMNVTFDQKARNQRWIQSINFNFDQSKLDVQRPFSEVGNKKSRQQHKA